MVVLCFFTGKGIGPLTFAPVRFTVSTISFADLSMSLWSKAFNLILMLWFCTTPFPLHSRRVKILPKKSDKIAIKKGSNQQKLKIRAQPSKKSANSRFVAPKCQHKYVKNPLLKGFFRLTNASYSFLLMTASATLGGTSAYFSGSIVKVALPCVADLRSVA